MEFIQDLNEAKLFGHSRTALKRYNAKEIADLLFLHILALNIMKYEFHGLPKAQKYVKNVGNMANFDYYVQMRNEVYILLHILIGKHSEMQRRLLKDKEASREFLGKVRINKQFMRKYLRGIMAGRNEESFERRFLYELERGLMIDNSYLRSMRRLVMAWPRQTEANKRLVMTRMLQLFRTKGRRSELLPMLEWLAKKEKMKDKSLGPLEGEGLGQNVPVKPKMSFLKGLAIAGAGAATGHYLAKRYTSK